MASNDIFSRGKHSKDLQDIFTGLFKETTRRSGRALHINMLLKLYLLTANSKQREAA